MIKRLLAMKIENLVALTLDKIMGFFDFWDLDKFLFVLLDLLPPIISLFSAICTNISKFSNELFIFNINMSSLAI